MYLLNAEVGNFICTLTYENESLQIADLCPPLPMALHPRLLLKATKIQANTWGISLGKSIQCASQTLKEAEQFLEKLMSQKQGEQDLTSTHLLSTVKQQCFRHFPTDTCVCWTLCVALPETVYVHFKLQQAK